MQPSVLQTLIRKLGVPRLQAHPVGGGSINQTYHLEGGGQRFFCKVNSATKFPHLFEREAEGLRLLAEKGPLRVPGLRACFEVQGWQALVLEWIDPGPRTAAFWKTFGRQLAALHHHSAERFGLSWDNYMGSVAQSNQPSESWMDFFAGRRLHPLAAACAAKGLLGTPQLRLLDRLYERLPRYFEKEKPALLHGDLWGGNFLCHGAGEPVLIDPAVYYGHRSMDLGMTRLFGGFSPLFYEAYHYHYPLTAHHLEQGQVCNLYPLLIHLLLFGSGYLGQIEETLKRYA